MDILIAAFIIISAYFLKGFSGFGPALIMIPFLSLIYDPATAIIVTTSLDFLAGLILIYQVRNDIKWSFVLPVILMMAIGAIFGAYWLGKLPVHVLQQIMGTVIALFALYILVHKEKNFDEKSHQEILRYPVGLVSGIFGGLMSISGPPMVIYMKMFYRKTFFRSQLIVIFLFGAGWRLILYYINNIQLSIDFAYLPLFILFMISGVFIGNKVHIRVSELVFSRIVAVVIFITSLKMIFD
jgi:uncharacterized membrane protein YfcA